jgi:hypothetical protein
MGDNEFAGSAAYLGWVWTGGTVDLYADYRNFTWAPSVNNIDATAGRDTFERMLPSYGVGSDIALEMVAQSDGTALAVALAKGNIGTLIYGPAGTVANSIAYSIPAYSQGPQWTSPFADVVQMNANFRQNAAETMGYWTGGTITPFA